VLDRLPAIPDEHRETIRSLRERLARVVALFAAGSYAEGLPASREVVEEAETIGWPPLVASARVVAASFLRESADYENATTEATTAYFQAVRIPDWDLAAEAAMVMVAIAGERRDQENGTLWGRHAEVALEQAADTAGHRAAVLFGNLGLLHASAGDYAEARALHERSRQIAADFFGEDHPSVSAALVNLATIDYESGDYARARSAFEQAIEIRERSLGPEHPDVATALKNLATVLVRTDRPDEAQALWRRALAIEERSLGFDHPRVSLTLNNLAIGSNRAGNYAEARELHERALAIREKSFGPDHPSVAMSLDNLAGVYEKMGDRATATELHERALVVRERALGPNHPELADTLNNLGVMLWRGGDRVRARTLIERGLAIRESALGPNHPDVAVSLTNLAALEEDETRRLAIYRRVLEIREAALGPDHPEVARALTNLALEQELDDRDTVDLLERALAIFESHSGVQPREAAARFALAQALVPNDGDATRAHALAEEALRAHRMDGDAEEAAAVERWLSGKE
jgi:tetratricopeptide (TPR) repeat protein